MIHFPQEQTGDRRVRQNYEGEIARSSAVEPRSSITWSSGCRVALLTGGGDKPYALGMAAALTAAGTSVDFIGSNDQNVREVVTNPRVNFLNLRGDQRSEVSSMAKIYRVSKYYFRLIHYAATAKPKLFHLLWNNKIEFFDRTVLMLYYKLLGKRVVFTAHNVNAGKRDQNDSWLNRLTLKIQYRLSDHIFVHTDGMKKQMVSEFNIPKEKISVIPFGINNTVPNTSLSSVEAKRKLCISKGERTLLFFGNIAPYKGLEYLIAAFAELLNNNRGYRLLIVGKPKRSESYWNQIQAMIASSGIEERIIQKIEYVPDEETELYFKAADVLVLPYTRIFQSGVLFLAYNFGLPVVAADVGDLREEIIEGQTGLVFKPRDSSDLARKIDDYFETELFYDLEIRRAQIKTYASERYSWAKVAGIAMAVYRDLLSCPVRSPL